MTEDGKFEELLKYIGNYASRQRNHGINYMTLKLSLQS